jgi:hypothetical protein
MDDPVRFIYDDGKLFGRREASFGWTTEPFSFEMRRG